MNEELNTLAQRIEKSLIAHTVKDHWSAEKKKKEVAAIQKFANDIARRIIRVRRREAAEERFRQALGVRLIVRK